MTPRTKREVGELVAKRRTELRYDGAGLARFAGVDPKTLSSLERGERWPRPGSRARIEEALEWEVGSLEKLRSGGDAAALPPAIANEHYPGKSGHILQMAVMDVLGKLQVVLNIALDHKDMRALTTSADAIAALSNLLREEPEESVDESETGLLDAVGEAIESVNEHGGPDQARNAH